MSQSTSIEQRLSSISNLSVNTPTIDMHLHVVDFLQKTDGLKYLIEQMDIANIEKCVCFGLPIKKKWQDFEPLPPHYYVDDNASCYYFSLTDEILAEQYMSLNKEDQDRFAPMICGFNPTDCLAIDHLEYIYNKYSFWKGVGELLLRHDDLTNLTNEETARVNHRALHKILDFCEDKKIPFMVHQNITSIGIHDRFEYEHEIKEVLLKHKNTTLVWAHCGISRRVFHKQYHLKIEEMLELHPNLYVDLAWVVYDDVICSPGVNLEPKEEWLNLIEKHSTRFMVGTDLCGHFKNLGKTISRYNNLFERLSSEATKNVSYNNANRIWFNQNSL